MLFLLSFRLKTHPIGKSPNRKQKNDRLTQLTETSHSNLICKKCFADDKYTNSIKIPVIAILHSRVKSLVLKHLEYLREPLKSEVFWGCSPCCAGWKSLTV